ncbi:thioredoxin family protein [Lewinella sp. IMCC34183]|uniref:thioredoxin family protein n=1 Tax=Lewinella sp. IMCC34183 TaxID=2248762 RepID=UPI000E24D0F4|nr:thioredoxin family protein [Lewinella sp. IMCC34183]
MKTLILSLTFLLVSLTATAQEWAPDFATAEAEAAAADKAVVLVFSGSDWCAPCIKLDREIWQDASFQEQAAADFVFYRADFPRKKENQLPAELSASNGKLAEQYNRRGAFPLVVVLTPEGEVLGETGYQKVSPDEYLAVLTGFRK